MKDIKVSVVIATYNGEETLRKALDSWLSQTLDNCEIVISDDCSKDNTRQIIAEYASKYPDIIVANYMDHNTRNSGAINKGVEIAHGKYVAIVDQDDWADKTMLEKLYSVAEKENADVACCDIKRVGYEDNLLAIENGNPSNQFDKITTEKRKLLFVSPGSRLCKIFLKDFLTKNKIEHCDNICYGDNYFMEHAAAYCNKISKVDDALYYYYCVDGKSTTRSYNNPITYDRVKSAEIMIESLEQRGFLDKYREEIEFRFIELFYVNSIHAFMSRFRPCEVKEITYLRNTVKQKYGNYRKNKYFKKRISKKNKLITLICDISPSLLCKIYTCYHGLKKKIK